MPTPDLFALHAADLARLGETARMRKLIPRAGRDFSSNDYLGLAGSRELADAARAALDRGVPVGSGGSRLLRGHHDEHQRLEEEAASVFGSEAALYFATGYSANSALLATLPQRGDLVIHDRLIHASAHEGLRLSRGQHVAAHHNDPGHVEELAAAWRRNWSSGELWIAVESLYSMDGDQAPLDALAGIADRHGAVLLIDEAHATGVFGRGGRGLAADLTERENVITLRTCGKALGTEGALVCCAQIVRDFLVNRARGFIFSTAPSPLAAATVRAALRILGDQPERREQLLRQVEQAQAMLGRLGFTSSGSQIQPVILGGDRRTMAVAEKLQAAGFDVRGIRPPTVPEGSSRLRISITLNATPADVDALGDALATILDGDACA